MKEGYKMNSLKDKMTKLDKILEIVKFIGVGVLIEFLMLMFLLLA